MHQPRSFDRRAFLKLAGCAGVAGSLPLLSPAIGLASLGPKLKAAQQTRMLMGTLVAVTVVDSSAQRAQDALYKGFSAMSSLAPMFDRHHPGGPVFQLNQEGRLSDLPPQLRQVLALTRAVHLQSGGAFDITVAPLVDAFKKSFTASNKPPSSKEIQAALQALGGLEISAQGLRLTKPGAAVTLDGVAKGYIVDQGIKALIQAGARHALINAGGDVAVIGDRGASRPWRVAVAEPRSPNKAKLVVKMTSGALATSGNYEVYFDQERLFHHIVNPATGRSPRSDTSASVRAPSAAVADALSTACFVMRPSRAMAFLRSQRQAEGLVLTRMGQRFQTKGFTS
jgi:thiamine biosynthesis lipoprotein